MLSTYRNRVLGLPWGSKKALPNMGLLKPTTMRPRTLKEALRALRGKIGRIIIMSRKYQNNSAIYAKPLMLEQTHAWQKSLHAMISTTKIVPSPPTIFFATLSIPRCLPLPIGIWLAPLTREATRNRTRSCRSTTFRWRALHLIGRWKSKKNSENTPMLCRNSSMRQKLKQRRQIKWLKNWRNWNRRGNGGWKPSKGKNKRY